MSLKFILIYATTVFIASITPGPSMLLALNHGIKYGARRTLATAAGNVTATLIQALLSIAGLGAILMNSQVVFNMIKYLGAVYLIYVGIRTLFSSDLSIEMQKETVKVEKKFSNLFSESFIVTIGNPKAIVFFTALFPQFISTQNETYTQFAVILSILLVIAFMCMMIYGFFGEKLTNLLNKAYIKKAFNRFVGTTFVGMGLGLAAGKSE